MDPPRWRVGQSAALSRVLTTLRNARELSENDEAFGRALVPLALQCVGREAGGEHRVAGPNHPSESRNSPPNSSVTPTSGRPITRPAPPLIEGTISRERS